MRFYFFFLTTGLGSFTTVSSTAVIPEVSNVAPAGINVVVTVCPSVVPLYTEIREASMPLSVTS